MHVKFHCKSVNSNFRITDFETDVQGLQSLGFSIFVARASMHSCELVVSCRTGNVTLRSGVHVQVNCCRQDLCSVSTQQVRATNRSSWPKPIMRVLFAKRFER